MDRSYGGFVCRELLDSGPFHEAYRATAPGEDGPGRFMARVIRHPGGPVPGRDEWESRCAQETARWEMQRAAAEAEPGSFAPVYDPSPGRHETGVFLITDYFPLDAARVIAGPHVIDAASLRAIVTGVYGAMLKMERRFGRPHGRVQFDTILFDRAQISSQVGVRLWEPASADELRPDADRARDVRALGELIYCLTTRERRPPAGAALTEDAAASFDRYRRQADAWREICAEMLSVGSEVDFETLESMRYSQRIPGPGGGGLIGTATHGLAALVAAGVVCVGAWYYGTQVVGPGMATPMVERLESLVIGGSAPDAALIEEIRAASAGRPDREQFQEATNDLLGWVDARATEDLDAQLDALEDWDWADLFSALDALRVNYQDARDAFEERVVEPSLIALRQQQPPVAPEEALPIADAWFEAAKTLASERARVQGLMDRRTALASMTPAELGVTEDADIIVSRGAFPESYKLSQAVESWRDGTLAIEAPAGEEGVSDWLDAVEARIAATKPEIERASEMLAGRRLNRELMGEEVKLPSSAFEDLDLATSGEAFASWADSMEAYVRPDADDPRELIDDTKKVFTDAKSDWEARIAATPPSEAWIAEKAQEIREKIESFERSPRHEETDAYSDATLMRTEAMRSSAWVEVNREPIEALASETVAAIEEDIQRLNSLGRDYFDLKPAAAHPRDAVEGEIATLVSDIASLSVPEGLISCDGEVDVAALEAQVRSIKDRASDIEALASALPAAGSWTLGSMAEVRSAANAVSLRLVDDRSTVQRLIKETSAREPTDLGQIQTDIAAAFEKSIGVGGVERGILVRLSGYVDAIDVDALEDREARCDALDVLDRLDSARLATEALRATRASTVFPSQADASLFTGLIAEWTARFEGGIDAFPPTTVDGLARFTSGIESLKSFVSEAHGVAKRLERARGWMDELTAPSTEVTLAEGAAPATFEAAARAVQDELNELLSKQVLPQGEPVTLTRGVEQSRLSDLIDLLDAWNERSPDEVDLESWASGGHAPFWSFVVERSSGGTDFEKRYAYFGLFRSLEREQDEPAAFGLGAIDRESLLLSSFGDVDAAMLNRSQEVNVGRAQRLISTRWTTAPGLTDTLTEARGEAIPANWKMDDWLAAANAAPEGSGLAAAYVLGSVDRFVSELLRQQGGASSEAFTNDDIESIKARIESVRFEPSSPWRRAVYGNGSIARILDEAKSSAGSAMTGPAGDWREVGGAGDVRVFEYRNGGVRMEFKRVDAFGRTFWLQRREMSLAQLECVLSSGGPRAATIRQNVLREPERTTQKDFSWHDDELVRGYYVTDSGVQLHQRWVSYLAGTTSPEDPKPDKQRESLEQHVLVGYGWTLTDGAVVSLDAAVNAWNERSPVALGMSMPLHGVSFPGALAIAESLNCRLPSPEEWAAALSAGGGDASPNTSDRLWRRQAAWSEPGGASQELTGWLRDAQQALGGGLSKFLGDDFRGKAPAPFTGSFRQPALEGGGAMQAFEDASDGFLWLRPTGSSGGSSFSDLVGNVAEWADVAAGERTVRWDDSGRTNRSESARIMGVSAMSGGGSASEVLDPMRAFGNLSNRLEQDKWRARVWGGAERRSRDGQEGFSDVGVRLAFDPPPATADPTKVARAYSSWLERLGDG